MIERAKYMPPGIGIDPVATIEMVENGVTKYVPDDMANRDRRELALWEAAGNVIEPAEPADV